MADLNGWIERDIASVWHGFTQMEAYAGNRPVIVERGEGRELIDVEGNRYLDAISSLWVTTLGHAVPELDEAVREQLGRVAHSTLLGNGNRIVIELAEALAARVPVERPRFLFASDGAAAVEQAIKIAFQYWTNQGVTSKTTYLAFGGAYHGDTTGSLAIGGGGFGTDVFDPLRFPVLRTPSLGTPGAVDQAVTMIAEHADEMAAVVLEPLVQGAAGMALVPPDAVAAVAEAARAHGVLVVHDEVATGFGRTGTLFASEQCGVRPDLLVIGKGITGGYLPLAATVASEQVWSAFLGPDLSEKTFYHGHSYSGNALGCAVALRHLELLDEWDVLTNVNARAEQLGQLLAERIEPLDAVAEVRRCGLMVGVDLAPPADGLRWGRRVSAGCVDRGVLIRPLGDVVVLMPPLTTTADEVVRIVDALEAAIREVAAG